MAEKFSRLLEYAFALWGFIESYNIFYRGEIELFNQKELMGILNSKSDKDKKRIGNVFVFCGTDENLIKKDIDMLKNIYLGKEISEFNYARLDGLKVISDDILNACETMPFMSEKKVVEIYRASFLADKDGGDEIGQNTAVVKFLEKYIEDVPSFAILIIYYVFKNNREKVSSSLKRLEKQGVTVVKVDKLKGAELSYEVKDLFEKNGVSIGRTELTLFCNEVENNFDIIEREVQKICAYANGRQITKEDIMALVPAKNESDIFNLISFVAENNIKKAIDTLNELVFRGEKVPGILRMLEKQYDELLKVKIRVDKGMRKEEIENELKMHQYRCQILISQCRPFTERYLCYMIEKCLECERRIKSMTGDSKTDMEMLIVEGAVARRRM